MGLEISELEQIRLQKLERLRQAGMEPYPHRVQRTHTTRQAIESYGASRDNAAITAAVVGRLRAIRRMGKATFAHIEDGDGRLQLYFRADDLGAQPLDLFNEAFDLGDFIQAQGTMFRTRSGEVTLQVGEFRLLAKAITPLPAAKEEQLDGQRMVHSAFANPEARYRQRYADLAVNPDVREVFRIRARVVRALQRFLDERGFLEVETPILQPIYGGAAARPFVTHHNQLHQDLY